MNIARQIFTRRNKNVGNVYRTFRFTSVNYAAQTSQPQVQEVEYDELKIAQRMERRKEAIPPFMKNIFVSIFNRDLFAYPEILNKEESEALDQRVAALSAVFSDSSKTSEDRRNALQRTRMYAAPADINFGGLCINNTESLRYLETISSDFQLSQEISDHWIALQALKLGFTREQYLQIIDDLTSGERTVALCIKERIAERILQADFRTTAALDGLEVWHINGEKVCHHTSGYFLVLCLVEGNRLKAFLVHPGAEGIVPNDGFVTFKNTPGTPLEAVSETMLATILGTSRLHAATLSRCRLERAMFSCVDYIKPRCFSGKPLSDLSTIRATIGNTLLDIYASESAEYFTAGLLDGYMDPDAELEMAMCRNFMANNGLVTMLKLLEIPALEQEKECCQVLNDMIHLVSRGESLDSINIFIALNGIAHAGKMMAEEIKQIRNPLFHPSFILKKVLADRHQEKDNPKMTLYLAEHLHPSLRQPANQLEYCVLRMKYACETLMSRHGVDVMSAYTELNRLAEAATEILVMTAVLARASRAYCIGLRNAEVEMKLAASFVDKTKEKVRRLILEIDDGEYLNLDHFRLQFGRKVLDTNSVLVEKPTARVFW